MDFVHLSGRNVVFQNTFLLDKILSRVIIFLKSPNTGEVEMEDFQAKRNKQERNIATADAAVQYIEPLIEMQKKYQGKTAPFGTVFLWS